MSLQDSKAEFQKRLLSQPTIKKQTYVAETDGNPLPETKKTLPAQAASSFSVYNTAQLTRMLYDVLKALKKEMKPVDKKEMFRLLAFDVFENDDLFELVLKNEKIHFDPSTRTFSYKPTFEIRSKDDLARVLQQNSTYGGVDILELEDSWQGCQQALEELEKEKRAILLRNKDGSVKLAYYNDSKFNLDISGEFKDMWKQVVIPSDIELHKELEKAGLKTFGSSLLKPKIAKQKGKQKRFNKRTRITNTHLEGIDIRAELNKSTQ